MAKVMIFLIHQREEVKVLTILD